MSPLRLAAMAERATKKKPSFRLYPNASGNSSAPSTVDNRGSVTGTECYVSDLNASPACGHFPADKLLCLEASTEPWRWDPIACTVFGPRKSHSCMQQGGLWGSAIHPFPRSTQQSFLWVYAVAQSQGTAPLPHRPLWPEWRQKGVFTEYWPSERHPSS